MGLGPGLKKTESGACLERKCLLISGEDAVQVGEQGGDALLAVHDVQPPVCLLVHPHLRACERLLHEALAHSAALELRMWMECCVVRSCEMFVSCHFAYAHAGEVMPTSGTGSPRRMVSTRRELAVMSQTNPLWYSGSRLSSPLCFCAHDTPGHELRVREQHRPLQV